jgi:cytidine deaminase
MNRETISFTFEVYDSVEELSAEDAWLLQEARKVTNQAYAPYSQFNVGAIARLTNGETVTGTNQENASYPVGLCAERVLLSAASSIYPNVPIETMAISYHNTKGESDRPVTPCGICRQTLAEYQLRLNHPIRLILSGLEGKIYIIPQSNMLLPLSFNSSDLQ